VRIDWALFHVLNGSLRGHPAIADDLEDFVTVWATPLFALATLALWLFDRPHRLYRWKVACLSGLVSAGLGLLLSQMISHLWDRPRPFVAHPAQTLLLAPPSPEPSFPSDHAVAAFAIAFSVLFVVGRIAGAAFLSAAFVVGVTRVFAGLHYPGDVAGGMLVGLLAATIVFYAGRRRWGMLVRPLSRVTDPLLAPAWRAGDAVAARRRARTTG
jgi:undecaprenyl-diphosphatase